MIQATDSGCQYLTKVKTFLQNKYTVLKPSYVLMENPAHGTTKRFFLHSNTGNEVDLQENNGLLRVMQWNILADG